MTDIRWERFEVSAAFVGGVTLCRQFKTEAQARRAADTAARRGYQAWVNRQWATFAEPGVMQEQQVYAAAPIVLPPWRVK